MLGRQDASAPADARLSWWRARASPSGPGSARPESLIARSCGVAN